MIFLKLAWRNIFRNYRRSAITASGVMFGLAALIFIWGFVDGINRQMIENSTRILSGHLQIHQRGYHEAQTLDLAFEQADRIRTKLLKEPEVAAVAPRLEGEALISGAEKTKGILVIGIDPAEEPKVTSMTETLRAGASLQPGETDAILLGDETAEAMRVSVGEEVTLVTQAADGSIGAGRYRVKGIFHTGIGAIDGAYVFLPLPAAQALYSLPNRITALAVRLHRIGAAPEVAARVQSELGASFEALPWQKLVPSVVQDIQFHEVLTYIVLIVVFAVAALGIANTILMGVMERVREFGVMAALGTRSDQILRLVLYEAIWIGLFGLLFGNLLGVGVVLYYARRGIDLSRYARGMELMPGLSGIVYPLLRVDRLLAISLVIFSTCLISGLYPAWKGARLRPVEAIQGIRRRSPFRRGIRFPAAPFRRIGSIFVRIAGRSLLRNPRRTALTLSAAALGFASFLFLNALADGFFLQMVENATGYLTGELQINRRGFRREMDPALSIAQPEEILTRAREDPRVAAASPRVASQAMISSPTQSEGILLFGVDPDSEPKITRLHRKIREGRYLRPGEDHGMLIGRKLADRLGVAPGEKVVVVAQGADGALGSAAFRIDGVFETGNDLFDRTMGLVTLHAAQSLLSLEGRASAIVIALKDRKALAPVAESLKGALSGTPYEAVTWETLLPEVVQMIALTRVDLYFVLIIVFGVAAMGVANTLLMSVMERVREFGVMMALGTRPSQIVKLVLYESAFLGLIGVGIGYVLGLPVISYFGSRGIDFSRYAIAARAIPGMTPRIFPTMIWPHGLIAALSLLSIGVAASLYPAWRAARLDPAPAIRHD